MRVGGNEAARSFFQKNGGSKFLKPGVSAAEKYDSPTAKKYKEELSRRVAVDASKYPGDLALSFETASSTTALSESESSTPSNDSTDDFFSSWEKKKPTPPISRSQTPISRTGSPLSAAVKSTSTDGPSTHKPSATRITPKPKQSILNTRKTGGSSILSNKSSGKKIIAKKVTSDIDFEAAEKAAKEEEERINKLGYNPNDESTSNINVRKLSTATSNLSLESSTNTAKKSSYSDSGFTTAPKAAPEVRKPIKLGFGQTSLPANQSNSTNSSAPSSRRSTPAPVSDGSVVAKFGNQKAISSDQMFGRNTYDPQAMAEARTRLAAFDGAQAISSSSYFGEDEEENARAGNGGSNNLNLERMAQDLAGRVRGLTNDDMSGLKDALEQGANKLGGIMRDYLR